MSDAADPAAAPPHPVQVARTLGQSLWLDDLHRGLLDSGALAAMVAQGLSGLTSNPAIFEKALAGGRYDEAIDRLAAQGHDARAIYETLAIEDVRAAADVLRPVFEASAGADGYVSLEVDPAYADDVPRTIADARRLAAAVARPNLMIKVPATRAGLASISRLLAEGQPVNATLIFAPQSVLRVGEAWLDALESRVHQGLPLPPVASVASFFVSRMDSAVDARLERMIAEAAGAADRAQLQALRGRAALAWSVLAHAGWRELLASPRAQALAARGARPQRLLWASTSTKNPAYAATRYVDGLLVPGTVNTLPPDTWRAFASGPTPVAARLDVDAARADVRALAAVGIDLHEVSEQLLGDGVRLFAAAFERLLATVDRRRQHATA